MLIITGTFKIEPEQRAVALEAAKPMMEASLAEDGCIEYVFLADTLRDDTVRIFEQWESEEALAAHAQTDHFKAAGSLLRESGVRDVDVVKHQISSSGPPFG